MRLGAAKVAAHDRQNIKSQRPVGLFTVDQKRPRRLAHIFRRDADHPFDGGVKRRTFPRRARNETAVHDREAVAKEVGRGRVAKDDPLKRIEREHPDADARQGFRQAKTGQLGVEQPDAQAKRLLRMATQTPERFKLLIGKRLLRLGALNADPDLDEGIGREPRRREPAEAGGNKEPGIERMLLDLPLRHQMPVRDDIQPRRHAFLDRVLGANVGVLPFLIVFGHRREARRKDRPEAAVVAHPNQIGPHIAQNVGDCLQGVRPVRRGGGGAVNGFHRRDEFVAFHSIRPLCGTEGYPKWGGG
ncbi:hypothetical protein ACNHKD_14540 [Methylocystis sp. JAN1]|uniref:hypothetical protein n=1 Tax=Methylocystis sp. JAN1 TaxID=3397211 RepID=UPI003FA2E32C